MILFLLQSESIQLDPLLQDKVYDPDPDRSYTKAKLHKLNRANDTVESALGQTIASSSVSSFDSFPPDDSTLFLEDYSVLPSFVPMDAFEQVKNSGKSVKKFANAEVVINSNDKGLRMMNFVHELQVYNIAEKSLIYLRACCWASYKRNINYKVKLVINQKGTTKIVAAKCDWQCPASNSGCCCHVMAVIWKLEEMTRKSELKTLTHDSLPCTSKPRQWGKGHRWEVEFHPVMASNVVQPRHASDLPGGKRRGIQSQFYDPRPPKCQKLDVDGMVKLKHDLQSINPTIPFVAMLPDEKSIPTIQTIVGTVAKGSIIHKQLQEFSTLSTVASCANSNSSVVSQVNLSPSCCSSHSTPSTQGQEQAQSNFNNETPNPSFSHEPKDSNVPGTSGLQASVNAQSTDEPHVQTSSVPQEELHSTSRAVGPSLTQVQQQTMQSKRFIETLTDEQRETEKETRGQSDNSVWFEQKQNRIPASTCKDVFSHMHNQRSKIPENLIKKISTKGKPYKQVSYLQAKRLNSKNKSMIYGIENEPVAANLYKEYLL